MSSPHTGNGNGNGSRLPERRALAVAILTGCVYILSYIGSQALLPALHGDTIADVGVGLIVGIALLCGLWLLRGPKRATAVGDRRKDPTLRADLLILAAIGFLAMATVSTMQVQLYRQNQMAARILRQQLVNENSILTNQQGILQNQAQSRLNETLIFGLIKSVDANQRSGATQRAQVYETVRKIDTEVSLLLGNTK